MKKKYWILIFAIFLSEIAYSQTDSLLNNKMLLGLELDVLPYATGGYFGAIAAGKNEWRIRVLYTKVNMPDWFVKDGFQNHQINSFAIVFDKFFKTEWKGWWVGGGPVFWKSQIENSNNLLKSNLKNLLLNGSLGHNFNLGKKVYISPWAGLSIRMSGDKNVQVGGSAFSIPMLNPETSIKLGFKF